MTEDDNSKKFLAEAYALNDQPSMDRFYEKWAEQYDEKMQSGLGYLSPQKLTRLFADQLSSNSYPNNYPDNYPDNSVANLAILDIGCGTGLAGHYLASEGFENIDGLDLSEAMISVARKRNCYRGFFACDLNKPLPIEEASYAGILCTGTFTHSHVGPDPLSEIVRILERGGLFACTVHFDLWESAGFAGAFERLCDAGELRELHRTADRFFHEGEKEGWFCVYQRL